MTSETPSTGPDAGPTPDIEVFWRPWCGFCTALRADLAARGVEATWRNIWEDEEAAELVRSVNRGNETVPTVRVGDTWLSNPSGRTVARLLESQADASG